MVLARLLSLLLVCLSPITRPTISWVDAVGNLPRIASESGKPQTAEATSVSTALFPVAG